MRWTSTKKLLIPTLLFLQSFVAFSQSKQVRFSDWIVEMEETHDIGFSYNHSLLDDLIIEVPNDCNDLPSCLANVQAPLLFEASQDKQYLVLPVRESAVFKMADAETDQSIEAITVTINKQQESYILPKELQYTIPNLFPTDSIQISSRFYSMIKMTAKELFANQGLVKMSPDTIYLQEVVISSYLASGVDANLKDHSMEIDMKSLGLLAGETDGDILNLLKSLPGIRTPDGKPGNLNFRGSTPDQTLIYFDEIPIYHSGHFFGTISPYNPDVISTVKVHRGVLPSQRGGRVGGMIELKTDDDVNTSGATASVNTVYAGASIQKSLIRNKLGIMLAARANYPTDYLPPKLKAFQTLNFQGSRIDPAFLGGPKTLDQFDLRFKDINGKLIYQINKNHQASVSLLTIKNRFDYSFTSRDINQIEFQTSNLDNWGITGKWDASLNEKLSVSSLISSSSLDILERATETANSSNTEQLLVTNTIDDTRFSTSLEYRISDQSTLQFGYQYTRHRVDLFDQRNNSNMPIRNSADGTISSFHLSSQHNWSSRLITNIGIRSDYYSVADKRYFDPRFSMSYMASDFLYFKTSAGVAHQFIKQELRSDFDDFRLENQFWKLANNRRQVLKGSQAMVGLLYDKYGWLLDLEFYSKRTTGVEQQPLGPGEVGTLQTQGADLFLKRRWSSFESWIGYSLSHTQTEFEELSTAYFDQRNILNLTFLYRLEKWSFATSWGYQSGMPVILPTLDPSDPNSNNQTSLSIPYTDNFPAQHQLDLSVTYKFSNKLEKWDGIVGLSILNLYDRKNIINIFQNNTREEQPYRYAVGFAPNVNVKFSL